MMNHPHIVAERKEILGNDDNDANFLLRKIGEL